MGGPVGLLPHRRGRIESASRLHFDIDAYHSGDVAAHAPGADWFRVWKAIGSKPFCGDSLTGVSAMLPMLRHDSMTVFAARASVRRRLRATLRRLWHVRHA
jgi:hypothetical protein